MSGGPYEYTAYLRKGDTLIVAHCLGEDRLAKLDPSTMQSWEVQAAAAAILESRGCRPVDGSWVWTEVRGSGHCPDYVTTFLRDEALW